MNNSSTIIIVVVALISLLIFYIIGVYNRIITSKNKVNSKWKTIDKEISNKLIITGKMVDIVKLYSKNYEDVLMNVLTIRNRLMNARGINEKIKVNSNLDDALVDLINLQDSINELKKDEKFIKLLKEKEEVNDRITYSKEFFNEMVESHNKLITKRSTKIVAKVFNFKKFQSI